MGSLSLLIITYPLLKNPGEACTHQCSIYLIHNGSFHSSKAQALTLFPSRDSTNCESFDDNSIERSLDFRL